MSKMLLICFLAVSFAYTPFGNEELISVDQAETLVGDSFKDMDSVEDSLSLADSVEDFEDEEEASLSDSEDFENEEEVSRRGGRARSGTRTRGFSQAGKKSSTLRRPSCNQKCCRARTARCLSCSKCQSQKEFCADEKNAKVIGCGKPRVVLRNRGKCGLREGQSERFRSNCENRKASFCNGQNVVCKVFCEHDKVTCPKDYFVGSNKDNCRVCKKRSRLRVQGPKDARSCNKLLEKGCDNPVVRYHCPKSCAGNVGSSKKPATKPVQPATKPGQPATKPAKPVQSAKKTAKPVLEGLVVANAGKCGLREGQPTKFKNNCERRTARRCTGQNVACKVFCEHDKITCPKEDYFVTNNRDTCHVCKKLTPRMRAVRRGEVLNEARSCPTLVKSKTHGCGNPVIRFHCQKSCAAATFNCCSLDGSACSDSNRRNWRCNVNDKECQKCRGQWIANPAGSGEKKVGQEASDGVCPSECPDSCNELLYCP